MLIPVLEHILLFFIYSFLGWICETIYCSIGSRHFVNRGFLNGPLCPVYGFGALIVVMAMRPFGKSVLLTFLAGVILTSALEYVTGWLLEKLFHLKLWDYSARFLNLHGRVCLKNSLMFGVMAVVTVFFIHPLFEGKVNAVPQEWMIFVTGILLGILIADLIVTVYTVLRMNGRLKQIEEAAEEFHAKAESLREEIQKQAEERREQVGKRLTRLKMSVEDPRFFERRMLKAFPHMRQLKYPDALEKLKNALSERKKKQK